MRRTVQDVMTRDVVTVSPTTPIKEVARLLNEARVNAVPVVDAGGRPVGMVAGSDLVLKEAAWQDGRLSGGTPPPLAPDEQAKARARRAGEVMTAPPVVARASTPVPVLARTLRDLDVHQMPVVDHAGVLIGIVARADLVKVFLRSDDELRFELIDHVIEDVAGLDATRLEVDVHDGVVTLRGTVDPPWRPEVVGRLAAAIDGVVSVDNRLSAAAAAPADGGEREER
jgi:CBS domain-containing protein